MRREQPQARTAWLMWRRIHSNEPCVICRNLVRIPLSKTRLLVLSSVVTSLMFVLQPSHSPFRKCVPPTVSAPPLCSKLCRFILLHKTHRNPHRIILLHKNRGKGCPV